MGVHSGQRSPQFKLRGLQFHFIEASEDIMTKFKSQAFHIIKIKYWKAGGDGSSPYPLENRHFLQIINRPPWANIWSASVNSVSFEFQRSPQSSVKNKRPLRKMASRWRRSWNPIFRRARVGCYRSVNFRMSFWCHKFSKKPTKNIDKFLPQILKCGQIIIISTL